jgi:hypothetical protein
MEYNGFSKWLDGILEKKLPKTVIAINFNLYEGSEQTYDVQLVGSDNFDEDDPDWPCGAVYSSEEDLYFIQRTENIEDWEQGLLFITELVKKYFKVGKYAEKLKNYKVVGIGFVSGDIDILYRSV